MALTEQERKERNKEAQRRYREKNMEKRAKWNRDWIAKHKDRYYEAKAEYRHKRKMEALHYYSKGTMQCAHCGYKADMDALCLDHINDDGAAHRKELGISSRGDNNGSTIYERLHSMGWMEGLQVLCFNCNTIKELRRKRGGRTSHEMTEAVLNPQGWHKRPVNLS